MPPTDADLARLTEAERQLLRLLVEGHTAKSIATQLECSVGSVNERLREARRKTGTGSSRELARLLRDQENRDEEIGVAGDGVVGSSFASVAGDGRRLAIIGLITMFIAIALATTFALQESHQTGPAPTIEQSSTPSIPADPLVDAALPRPTMQETRAKLHSEGRDEAWASQMEGSLREQYLSIPQLAPDPVLRVTCARTICEVVGTGRSGLSLTEQNKFMYALQGGRHDADKKLGLVSRSGVFTSFKPDRKRTLFVSYLARKAPDAK